MTEKIISFCLWGDIPRYNIGAIKNAELAYQYYPDFNCWFYIHQNSVPASTIETLARKSNVKIIFKNDEEIKPNLFMSWRFHPYDDPNVELFISRDTDTRILEREALAVREWLKSDKTLHIMRDSPCHYPKILGGMFGLRKTPLIVNMCEQISNYFQENTENDDQNFLADVILPSLPSLPSLSSVFVHDEIKKYEGELCHKFPIPWDREFHFVGEYVFEDESRDSYYTNIQREYIQQNLSDRITANTRNTGNTGNTGTGNYINQEKTENFRLGKCLVACDNNKKYWEFFPLVKKCWKEIVGLDVTMIMVSDIIPEELLQYKDSIILFKPIENINTAFQAQCIRLLYPALLNCNGVIISDMDLIPLNKTFYTDNSSYFSKDTFVIYRDCISQFGQYPICFCAAYPEIWSSIFNIKTDGDIRTLITKWYLNDYNISDSNSRGWAQDQIQLYNSVNKWKGSVAKLQDKFTKFNRLDRSDMAHVLRNVTLHKEAITKKERTDFHLPPYNEYKEIIHHLLSDVITEDITVYIIHYSKLSDRKKYMEKQLVDFGINNLRIKWIDNFDREIITEELRQNNYMRNPSWRELSPSEIANGIAHNHALESISLSTNLGLVLEDDIILKPGFLDYVYKCIKMAPSDWDILTLGGDYNDGTGKYDHDYKDITNGELRLEVPDKICTTVSCYLLKPQTARKIMSHKLYKPFCYPIDETLCHILPELELKVFWAQPWLAYEGSKSGIFKSCILDERKF